MCRRYTCFSPTSEGSATPSQSKHWFRRRQVCRTCSALAQLLTVHTMTKRLCLPSISLRIDPCSVVLVQADSLRLLAREFVCTLIYLYFEQQLTFVVLFPPSDNFLHLAPKSSHVKAVESIVCQGTTEDHNGVSTIIV